MKFNSNGKLARFYLFTHEYEKLPNDFCSYFWGLVGGTLRVLFVSAMLAMLLAVVIYLATGAVRWAWAHKSGVFLMLAVFVIAALAVWWSERKTKIEILSETKAIITGKIDAIKGRYCPRIEWK
jgi:uncharacterized membrane protein YjjP (DUF1212 family)